MPNETVTSRINGKKELTNVQLQALFDSGDTPNPLDEILLLVARVCPTIDGELIRKVHTDIAAIFSGQYPGFKFSATKYHNLRHTYAVVLASIRLFHGLFLEKRTTSPDLVTLGLLSAYFHDSGMLLQITDKADSGANYTKNHEVRSTVILAKYLRKNGFPQDFEENCEAIIKYTNLAIEAENIDIDDKEVELCGQVIGTADLLAQMADRYYLESLPLLFQEYQDGGIDNYSSALDLMTSTVEFHEKVIKKRLKNTLGDVAPSMQTHFHKHWGIDKNIYLDNIQLNIDYLRQIIKNCDMNLGCWAKYLRRTPPPTR